MQHFRLEAVTLSHMETYEKEKEMETQINDPVTVTILHRNNEQFGDCWELTKEFNSDYAEYTPSWKEVYSYEVDNSSIGSKVDGPHEDCFEINNRVYGTDNEMPVKFQTRSLSVGDVVVLSHPNAHYLKRIKWIHNSAPSCITTRRLGNSNYIPEFYFVDSFGWVKLDEKDFVHEISLNEIQLEEVK